MRDIRGAGPRFLHSKKLEFVGIRMSGEDKERVMKRAQREGLVLSDYLRGKVFQEMRHEAQESGMQGRAKCFPGCRHSAVEHEVYMMGKAASASGLKRQPPWQTTDFPSLTTAFLAGFDSETLP